MKNFKKILSLVLALVMVASTFITANAADIEIVAEGQCGENVYWKITSDGLLDIYGDGDMKAFTNVNPPSYYEYRDYFNQVKFEEGVTSIGEGAFGTGAINSDISYANITKAPIFADSIKSIGGYAFSKCPNMTGELILPDNLEMIYSCAFQGCRNLTGDLIIPDGVKEIRYAAFHSCSGLNGKIKLSESLETIGSLAFAGCYSLVGDLIIPEGLKTISYAAFQSCAKLDGCLVLPDGLTEIGSQAFYSCSSLTGTLDIPETVTTIGKCAFHDVATLASPEEFFENYPEYFYSIVEDTYYVTVTKYYCSDCDQNTESIIHNHSYDVVTENIKEATSTVDGSYDVVYRCNICGKETDRVTRVSHCSFSDRHENDIHSGINFSFDFVSRCDDCNEEITRHTNYLSKYDAVEPTIDAAGNVEYYMDGNGVKYIYEDNVYKYIADASVSYCSVNGHTESAAVKDNIVSEKDCSTDGVYDLVTKCEVCGEELSRKTVTENASGHTPLDTVIENYSNADENADGSFNEVIYCADCGEVISTKTKTVHLPDEKTVIENATASENNGSFEVVVYCKNCNEELSRTVINLSKVDAVEPTKETAGSIAYFIDDNGTKYVYDNGTFTVTENTSISYCEANGHTESEAVIDNIISEKDCVTDGIYDKIVCCEICNKELSRETITDKATGHNPSTSTVENYIGSTETSDGSFDEVTYCKDCGEIIEKNTSVIHSDEVIYRTENDMISDTENSFELITLCKNCEEELSREVITLTKVDVKEPTVNELGNAEHYEDKDGNEFIITNGKFVQVENTIITYCEHFGHSKREAVVENHIGSKSCTESETYESVIYCSVCGEEISREKVTEEATGHDKSEPIIVTIKEANCSEKGSHIETIFCKTCGEKVFETTVIDPVTDHNWGEGNVVSGEYDKNTVEEFTCTDCGEKKVEISKNPNYQFRCKRCDWYDSQKGSNPILYFIYTIVHSITHFVQSINYAT